VHINNVVTCKDDRGKAYEPYLLDPSLLVAAPLPPLFLVTSDEDLIQKDTLKLDGLLTAAARNTSCSTSQGRRATAYHVFSVSYPMFPESREVFDKMSAYLLAR
jgi:hypothetical protein